MSVGLVLGAIGAAAWLYLALARGGFWLGRESDQTMHQALVSVPGDFAWPGVTAVIPARNEAELVGRSVASLLQQRYPGRLDVVVVDDHSDDGTASVAANAAEALGASERLHVVAAPALPAGWTGKLWAVANGVSAAEAMPMPSDYLLLTDADIGYDDDAVAALVFGAVGEGWVLSSLMVKLRCQSLAERALIPAFVFFFQMIYPFAWVNQANRRLAAAAGGCMLVRRDGLAAAGGVASIRGAIIDDCALGARLKAVGPIHLALGERVQSLRASARLGDVRRMVVRSAYAQLGYSLSALGFVVVAMLLVFVAPVLLALLGSGWAQALGASTWALMAVVFLPTTRHYRVSPLWCLGLPAIAAVYLVFTVESALQHRRGRGGLWKGRAQAHVSRPR
ncbi:MAG: glycosyltransferase [Pseudomonadota bacterium]|nr:glycosyltransferase [Pseudomonadota bacterium]